jgi:2-iminobutanoate/2-iminopropanoate deaminase
MDRRSINPTKTGWAQGHEISNPSRILFVSGQVPQASDGNVPNDFKAQCRLAWVNVERQLQAAQMTLDNLVKMTIFLSDRCHIQDAYEVRAEVLGKNKVPPAMTIIITGIYDEAWLLEIEAIAAA